MLKTKKLRMICLAAVVTMACAAPAGAIAPVTVVDEFTHYSGPVAYAPDSPNYSGSFGPSYFNGVEMPPHDPSPRPGVGVVDFDFTPGTTSIEFYNGIQGSPNLENPNLLKFTPAAEQNVSVGQEFKIGTFTLQNGSWLGGLGEGDSLFSFSVTTSSTDPLLDGHTFSDVIRYVITQGLAGNTAEQNADTFGFVGRSDLGTMSVYEIFDSPTGSNIGSIDLYGQIGSLIPTRFANPQGGVFVAPPTVTPVPEPESYAMLLAGLGLVGAAVRRQKRVGKPGSTLRRA